jgi:hypothetical protein
VITIEQFWSREIKKCTYVKERRILRKEEFQENQKQEDIRRAMEEAAKDQLDDVELQKELESESDYQELLLKYKAELGLISPEEFEAISKEKKKKK